MLTHLKPDDTLLTAKEAARRLGVTDARVRQLLLDGTIRGHKISKLLWLIPESEITRYQNTRRPAGRPARTPSPKP